jgi:hypothetical protein
MTEDWLRISGFSYKREINEGETGNFKKLASGDSITAERNLPSETAPN